jgi:hypothetical protein
MKVKIQESGVVFGDFDTRDVFTIEQALIAHRISEKGVKTVEFILLQTHSGNQVVSFAIIPQMNDAFRKVLKLDCQLWGIEHSAVFVLNQSRATKLGLIQP